MGTSQIFLLQLELFTSLGMNMFLKMYYSEDVESNDAYFAYNFNNYIHMMGNVIMKCYQIGSQDNPHADLSESFMRSSKFNIVEEEL